jgi:chitinase
MKHFLTAASTLLFSLPALVLASPHHVRSADCTVYTVASGDYCYLIATNNGITTDDLTTFNANTWGWNGCAGLQPGQKLCVSAGSPPMPASVAGTVCGPQVAGTAKPADMSTLAGLNPCPLNQWYVYNLRAWCNANCPQL